MKKIMIIGAGFLQSFVIKKAKEMGYFTISVDGDPSAVGFNHSNKHAIISIIDKETCLKFAKQEGIDGVLTAATDYGVLTAAYIAKELNLPGLKYEVAELIKNKFLVRKRFIEFNVDDKMQAYEVNSTTDLKVLGEKLTYPVMVKPCDGSGSRGVIKVQDQRELAEACKIAINSALSKKAEIETFIIGKEYGAESLVIDGKIYVLGIMQKFMTKPPYYAELGHAIPNDLSLEANVKIKKCIQKAIQALGIDFGSVNMDILITEYGKVHIIDVGARMGGNMIGSSIIPLGTGIDYIENMIKNAVGDEVDFHSKGHKCVASKIIALKDGVIKRLPNFQEIQDKYKVEIYHHMSVGKVVNNYKTNLDGCGYVIAEADTIDIAVNNAEKALKEIAASIF